MALREIATVLAVVAGLTTSAVTASATVRPATGDLGDPKAHGCTNGAYQVEEGLSGTVPTGGANTGQTQVGTIRLMYSPSCNTNWAEADGIPVGIEVKILVWNKNGAQSLPVVWFTTASSTWGWTDMVDGHVSAGASIDAGDSLGPYYLYQQGAPPPGDIGL